MITSEKVSSKYGAPMGRDNGDNPEGSTVLVQKMELDGDYDAGGAYWGCHSTGSILYMAFNEEGFFATTRAFHIGEAKEKFLKEHEGLVIADSLPYTPLDAGDKEDLLEEFMEAYKTAALWSSNDESDESGGVPLDDNYGTEDFSEAANISIRKDCYKFCTAHEELIRFRASGAGHDFWLTRNGHGAGFWDGDWPEQVGKDLTEASKLFPECYLYVQDGKIGVE